MLLLVLFFKYSCLSPNNKVFSSSSKNSGFVRVAANSGKTGSSPSVTKHYAAISMSLEATAILGTSITASSTLYFQCSLKPCYDDGSGQCGGVGLQCSINSLCANGFFLLVQYIKLGMVHGIYQEVTGSISRKNCISFSQDRF